MNKKTLTLTTAAMLLAGCAGHVRPVGVNTSAAASDESVCNHLDVSGSAVERRQAAQVCLLSKGYMVDVMFRFRTSSVTTTVSRVDAVAPTPTPAVAQIRADVLSCQEPLLATVVRPTREATTADLVATVFVSPWLSGLTTMEAQRVIATGKFSDCLVGLGYAIQQPTRGDEPGPAPWDKK